MCIEWFSWFTDHRQEIRGHAENIRLNRPFIGGGAVVHSNSLFKTFEPAECFGLFEEVIEKGINITLPPALFGKRAEGSVVFQFDQGGRRGWAALFRLARVVHSTPPV